MHITYIVPSDLASVRDYEQQVAILHNAVAHIRICPCSHATKEYGVWDHRSIAVHL